MALMVFGLADWGMQTLFAWYPHYYKNVISLQVGQSVPSITSFNSHFTMEAHSPFSPWFHLFWYLQDYITHHKWASICPSIPPSFLSHFFLSPQFCAQLHPYNVFAVNEFQRIHLYSRFHCKFFYVLTHSKQSTN